MLVARSRSSRRQTFFRPDFACNSDHETSRDAVVVRRLERVLFDVVGVVVENGGLMVVVWWRSGGFEEELRPVWSGGGLSFRWWFGVVSPEMGLW